MKTFKQYSKKKRPMRWKSGGFPYFIDPKTGDIFVCLFTSNDPDYGGKHPQMPKGTRDDSEAPVVTGAREAAEETGIPYDALKRKAHMIMNKKFRGETSTYIQYAFGFPLDKPYTAKKNSEGKGLWYRADDARKVIRRDQKVFLTKLLDNLEK